MHPTSSGNTLQLAEQHHIHQLREGYRPDALGAG
jgi:hypothetical protein